MGEVKESRSCMEDVVRRKSTKAGKEEEMKWDDTLEYREAAARCGAASFIAKDTLNFGRVEMLINAALSGPNKPR